MILAAVMRGLPNKAISKELWVTEQTVKFHLSNIYRKLGVPTEPRPCGMRRTMACSNPEAPWRSREQCGGKGHTSARCDGRRRRCRCPCTEATDPRFARLDGRGGAAAGRARGLAAGRRRRVRPCSSPSCYLSSRVSTAEVEVVHSVATMAEGRPTPLGSAAGGRTLHAQWAGPAGPAHPTGRSGRRSASRWFWRQSVRSRSGRLDGHGNAAVAPRWAVSFQAHRPAGESHP